MKKGVLLFAFNSPKYNYYEMAEFTAKRVNHFLNLPVTLVTDEDSLPNNPKFNFDEIILTEPNKSNKREFGTWINKDRFKAYEFSPYEETILLDVDYIINSNKLLDIFNIYDDFACHDTTKFFMYPKAKQEILSKNSFNILWATVIAFKKTSKTKQLFECMEMIQNNLQHYVNIHGFIGGTYRNDYALTLATRIVNGHKNSTKDFIPWSLWHVNKDISLYKNTTNEFNTEYTAMIDVWKNGKSRKDYITIKDFDFHLMSKDNFKNIV
jgi:hypothetical protein